MSQDTRVGYLKQRDNFDSEGTVIGEIDKIFTEIHALEAQIEQVTAEIEAGKSDAAQIEKLDRLHLAYEQKGGYTYKSEITGILHSMAFTSEFYSKKIGSLSGGERTRLALAALPIECFPQPYHTHPAHSRDRHVYLQSSSEPQSLTPEPLKLASKRPLFRMPSMGSSPL